MAGFRKKKNTMKVAESRTTRGEHELASAMQEPGTSREAGNALPITTANTGLPIQAKAEGDSPLMELPVEIKQRIWALAITHDEPITPMQLRPRSNKFIWSEKQAGEDGKRDVAAVKPLTAVQLSLVCRTIYQEIATTHLFYRNNHFSFKCALDTITFLVAITEARRNTIVSITTDLYKGYWNMSGGRKEITQTLTMIASCGGLRQLEIVIPLNWRTQADWFERIASGKDALGAVQGLKVVELTAPETTVADRAKLVQTCKNIKESWAEVLKLPRKDNYYSLAVFHEAQFDVALDIHGGGRLSDDKRPAVIASRTRLQIRNVPKIDAHGILPKREIPKYDLNGDLAWFVSKIVDCRNAPTDEGSYGVEFLTQCRNDETSDATKPDSWEDVSVLNSRNARAKIIDYYDKHPDALGMKEVLEIWEYRLRDELKSISTDKGKFGRAGHRAGRDFVDPLAERHAMTYFQQRLAQMIKKQADVELAQAKREAGEAKRQAAKARKQSSLKKNKPKKR